MTAVVPKAERARASDARYCGHCAFGAHHRCHSGSPCECRDQRHRPDDRVAAAMTVFQRLDLTGSDRRLMALAWRRRYPAPDDPKGGAPGPCT